MQLSLWKWYNGRWRIYLDCGFLETSSPNRRGDCMNLLLRDKIRLSQFFNRTINKVHAIMKAHFIPEISHRSKETTRPVRECCRTSEWKKVRYLPGLLEKSNIFPLRKNSKSRFQAKNVLETFYMLLQYITMVFLSKLVQATFSWQHVCVSSMTPLMRRVSPVRHNKSLKGTFSLPRGEILEHFELPSIFFLRLWIASCVLSRSSWNDT